MRHITLDNITNITIARATFATVCIYIYIYIIQIFIIDFLLDVNIILIQSATLRSCRFTQLSHYIMCASRFNLNLALTKQYLYHMLLLLSIKSTKRIFNWYIVTMTDIICCLTITIKQNEIAWTNKNMLRFNNQYVFTNIRIPNLTEFTHGY